MSDHPTKPSCLLRAVIKSDNSPCECRIVVARLPERENLRRNGMPITTHYVIKIKIDGKIMPERQTDMATTAELFPSR